MKCKRDYERFLRFIIETAGNITDKQAEQTGFFDEFIALSQRNIDKEKLVNSAKKQLQVYKNINYLR